MDIDASSIRIAGLRADREPHAPRQPVHEFHRLLTARVTDGVGLGGSGGFGAGPPPPGFWKWVGGSISGAAKTTYDAIAGYKPRYMRPDPNKYLIGPKMSEGEAPYSGSESVSPYFLPGLAAGVVVAVGAAAYGARQLYNLRVDPGYQQVQSRYPANVLPEIRRASV
jgi:hypothetical protein